MTETAVGLKRLPKMVQYEVVSCAELGGALVREGRSLTSKQIARLSIGAIISEEEKAGERLRFKKISGSGPNAGWVSTQLLLKVDQKASSPSPAFAAKSLLAKAEAKVIQQGSTAVLKEYSEMRKDGEALVYVSLANLVEGQNSDALAAAEEACSLLKGKTKDAEASSIFALALSKLATGEARQALSLIATSLALYREVGDKQMEASSLATSANARLALREVNIAEASVKDALKIFREIGDLEGEHAAQLTFQDICVAKEGLDKARKTVSAEQAAYHKSKGDKRAEATSLLKLAEQHLSGSTLAMHEEALKLSQQALSIVRQAGEKKLEASALHAVATAELLGPAEALSRSQSVEEALQISKAIGDESSQVDLLFTLTSLRLVNGQTKEALKIAEEARILAKRLCDQTSEARSAHAAAAALLADGQHAEALSTAHSAAKLFGATGNKLGAAGALQTAAAASVTKAGSFEDFLDLATSAIGLYQLESDLVGEAQMQLQFAKLLLSYEGTLQHSFKAKLKAGQAAERARSLFLLLGDKRNQSLASHLASQSKMLTGDIEGGLDAAMQAVVLARNVGDKWLEASALRTAMGGQVTQGHLAEALRMAKEVQALFRKLGSTSIEEAIGALMLQIEEAIPKQGQIQRLTVQPRNNAMNLSGSSVFSEVTNCIVWSIPVTQQTYILYCLELLKFVDDLKNVPGKISFLVLTRGVMGRHTGEPVPTQYEGVTASTVWAVCRTIRLESPRLLVTTVDVPSSATVHEMTECIRAARYEPGARNEMSFIVDRANQLGKRPR